MQIRRLAANNSLRWAMDGEWLEPDFSLARLLKLPAAQIPAAVQAARSNQLATGEPLAPVEPQHEVWAAGVTYLRSREARQNESSTADVYQRVYTADRPELFFKAAGWRVVGDGQPVRIRRDSRWNVPEPELTLVTNRFGEVVGYCAGNDVSSRDIEGANPLYLPQAKVYNGSCALGPGIELIKPGEMPVLPVRLEIARDGRILFAGETSTGSMKRSLAELVGCLYLELDFPLGAFLMTGTGIVPPDDFSLQPGDRVAVEVGTLRLVNPVE